MYSLSYCAQDISLSFRIWNGSVARMLDIRAAGSIPDRGHDCINYMQLILLASEQGLNLYLF